MARNQNMRNKIKIFRFLIIMALVFFALIILILITFRIEDTVISQGVVKALHEYDLKSMVDGRLLELQVEEGATVKKGAVILKLDDTKLKDEMETLKARIRELQSELEVKNKNLVVTRRNPLPKEFRYAEISLNECRDKFRKSKEQLDRYQTLYQRQVVSKATTDKIEVEYYQAKADYERALNTFRKVAEGLENKILEKAESEIQLLLTKLNNEKVRLGLMENHLGDYTLTAPADGEVIATPQKAGCFVEKGDVLVRLATEGTKKIIAYVDQRFVSKIHPDQEVKIISQLYDYFKFGFFSGKVKEVCEVPVKSGDSLLYPVEILIMKEPYPLKHGSAAELRIITGKERIISIILGLNR